MKPKILVIEDNEQNMYLVTFILAKHGYQIVQAQDGRKGIELAGQVVEFSQGGRFKRGKGAVKSSRMARGNGRKRRGIYLGLCYFSGTGVCYPGDLVR